MQDKQSQAVHPVSSCRGGFRAKQKTRGVLSLKTSCIQALALIDIEIMTCSLSSSFMRR